jgi:two-component system CheB/CheR fusion protein
MPPRNKNSKNKATKAKSKASKPATREPPQEANDQAHADGQVHDKDRRFPIVGIGASAGGLEALEQFLTHMPHDTGMAFVIVQHLDPTHKGAMAELLQRSTRMKVAEVRDRMKVQPDCVYIIPPNKDMSILHGVLHLLDPAAPRGLRLPIDSFFRSLAEDRQERSMGVILSGMGTDGSLGLRAMKEKGGVVFVQAPASSKFDGMPRSAIEAGLADVIAPVEELPDKIIALRNAPLVARTELPLDGKSQPAFEKIMILLRAHSGHDFSLYKKNSVYRRIERRMGIHQIDKIATYLRFLQENPQELALLFKELLIGVTSFFRDPPAWEHLKTRVMPSLLADRPARQALRAWVPGCATGEEAYSLAIVFREATERIKAARNLSLQIFATDLDQDAIDKARLAVYPTNIAVDVSPERLRRFFIQDDRGYRIAKDIREMVIFAAQNVVMDPPFTKLDILICRNLLIYLSAELQKKLLPLFHYSLNPRGILFLGSAETAGSATGLFAPLDGKTRLYRRLEAPLRAETIEFPSSFSAPMPPAQEQPKISRSTANLQVLTDQLILQRYSPPAVLVNDKGDLLYVSGRTGKYLEPAAGKANWNIFAMAREGLRYELTGAFRRAFQQNSAVGLSGLKVRTNGGVQPVDAVVQPIQEPEALRGTALIIFRDTEAHAQAKTPGKTRRDAAADTPLVQMEQELQQVREELQTTREEMQTSQEELKSTNEELQSANEELQSTNEELTTSKEEMQSLNEELQTVNHELQSKVDELSRSNNDMKNLLNSAEIALLFLDSELRVRRFTSQTSHLIKLIPGDAGRPITDIASDLVYPQLPADVHEVLRTLASLEKSVATRTGHWYKVRISAYRTLEDKIDGVLITFTDITAAKELENQLRETRHRLDELAQAQARERAECEAARKRAPDGAGERSRSPKR